MSISQTHHVDRGVAAASDREALTAGAREYQRHAVVHACH